MCTMMTLQVWREDTEKQGGRGGKTCVDESRSWFHSEALIPTTYYLHGVFAQNYRLNQFLHGFKITSTQRTFKMCLFFVKLHEIVRRNQGKTTLVTQSTYLQNKGDMFPLSSFIFYGGVLHSIKNWNSNPFCFFRSNIFKK